MRKIMYKKLLSFLLLSASFLFANETTANWFSAMEKAEREQALKILPLLLLAIGIALFFSLIQRSPQKAVLGCGGFFAIAFILGIFTWFLDFVARHAFVFILLGVLGIFVCLIVYMIYTPPSPQKSDKEDEENNHLL